LEEHFYLSYSSFITNSSSSKPVIITSSSKSSTLTYKVSSTLSFEASSSETPEYSSFVSSGASASTVGFSSSYSEFSGETQSC